MKRFLVPLTLLVLTIAAVGGIILQQRAAAALLHEADRRAREAADAYVAIVEEEIVPLVAAGHLSPQRPAAGAALAARDVLRDDLPLAAVLRNISGLQMALWDLTNNPPPTGWPSDFRKRIENHSPVAGLLEAYNGAAIRWNRTLEGTLARLTASITGEKPQPLPFLRFDGQQEYVPVIQL